MKFAIFEQHGALNSKPVFRAFVEGCKKLNIDYVINPSDNDYDVAVIWSMLWRGNMAGGRAVWDHCNQSGKKVIVLEVGGLKRNHLWRVGIGGINREAEFANSEDIGDRYQKIGLKLKPWTGEQGKHILICTQNPSSYQWRNMPSVETWLKQTIADIREFHFDKIIVRPHPRAWVKISDKDVEVVPPQKLPNTYDDVDIDSALEDTKFVVNYCTNPGIDAVVKGVPVMVGSPSLAYPVSMKGGYFNFYEPDREEWIKRLSYIEWTEEEIAQAEPLARLLKKL